MQKLKRILILGDGGVLDAQLCCLLAETAKYEVWLATHHLQKAEGVIKSLKTRLPEGNMCAYGLDPLSDDFLTRLKASQASVLIYSVPSSCQKQDFTVADACVASRIHYIDFASDREFVTNIDKLDKRAKEEAISVISGATFAPAISSVVIDTYAKKFGLLREIEYGIVLGNQIAGESAQKSVQGSIGALGQPFRRLENGEWKSVYRWQNCSRHYYGDNIGLRWHANQDSPDLLLLPKRYPQLKTVLFHSGMEVGILHFFLCHLAWLVRAKLIRPWRWFEHLFNKLIQWRARAGTDRSGMYVRMRGSDLIYQPLEIKWTFISESGHAAYVPLAISVLLVDKILDGSISAGAQPCVNLFSLEEFNEAVSNWNVYFTVEEKEF